MSNVLAEEFTSHLQRATTTLETMPAGAQRDRVLMCLYEARSLADEMFGATRVLDAPMSSRMS